MKTFRGISISPGYALGFAAVHHFPSLENIPEYTVVEEDLTKELARMTLALEQSEEEICAVRDYIAKDIGDQEAAIFDAHLLFLRDNTFRENLFQSISQKSINSEQAIKQELIKINKQLSLLKSTYMRERIADIEDVGLRLLRNLRHNMPDHPLANLPENTIVAAKELLPDAPIAVQC